MSYEIDLGSWGTDLDDAAYGRALAALGVGLGAARRRSTIEVALARGTDAKALRGLLDRTPTIPWDIAPVLALEPEVWAELAARHPAGAFASAWAGAVGEPAPADVPRLEIARFTDEIGRYTWLADQLMQPAAFAAPFAVAAELQSEHLWEWPLRIGFLGDAMANLFRARLHPEDWPAPVGSVGRVSAIDGADLLILPQALPDALARLARRQDPIDIGCVLILGGLGGETDLSAKGVLHAAWDRTEAWGVAIANLPSDAADAWLSGLVGALADDVTLDLALRRSFAAHGRGVLFAEPEALAMSTVSNASEATEEIGGPAGAEPPEEDEDVESFDLPGEATGAEVDGIGAAGDMGSFEEPPPPDLHIRQVPKARRRSRAPRPSRPPGQRAEPPLHAPAGAEPPLAKPPRAEPPRVERRFIQVEIREAPDFAGAPLRRALIADTAYGIDVWVGPATGAIRGEAALPEEDLPKDGRTVRLTVVFAELDGERRTQTATIPLPPTGAGRPHRFAFRTSSEGTFRARIIVSYKNRILQTALLDAPVTATASASAKRTASGAPAARIALRTEAAVRPGLAELTGRRSFGVALVHNHDARGVPGGTVLRGGQAVPLELGDIGRTVDTITSLLSEAAEDPKAYGPTLEAEATVTLLFKLAHQGVLLHDDLLGRPSVAALLEGAERMQILTADPNAILPLEFVYDLPAPSRPPKLCPNAKTALREGRCDGREHHEDAAGTIDVVCPSGFWAMSRVIERHIADPDALGRAGGLHFELASEPIAGRDRLVGLTGAVFAASARVDQMVAGSATLVETTLAEMTGGHATRAKTWGDWVKTVKASQPSLLVLLAHSVRDDLTAMTALEIETDERRDAAEFTTRYLRADGTDPAPPVVFLLGCDTAVADLQYQTFVTRFRQLGAALVVGTISTVAGSHAAEVAAALIRAVKREHDPGWLTFGDLLRDVRRTLLSDGEVMALCLTAYGDADWRFPGGRTRPATRGDGA